MVGRVRRLWHTKAVGHTGTLDPFASGLLVLLLGPATRLARFVSGQAKTYQAGMRLGEQTDSDDRTGTVVARWDGQEWPDQAQVEEAMAQWRGKISQVPPAYSAKRVKGERSYRLAREGRAVPLMPAEVEVHSLTLETYAPPDVGFRCTVSSGTYIRALARDIGVALQTGAHLSHLRRTEVGHLSVTDAVPFDALREETATRHPIDVLDGYPRMELTEGEMEEVAHGRPLKHHGEHDEGTWAVLARGGAVIAMALYGPEATLQPKVVLTGAVL